MFGFLRQQNEKWVKERLSLYLDGRLDVGQRAKVESHLKDCLACRDELASLQATVEALKHLPMVETPRSFVMPALKLSPRPVTFYRLRMATVAVSVLLVAVIAGDSLGMFFRPEALKPLMAPAPAAMSTPPPPAASMAVSPTAAPTAVPAPAGQPAPAPRVAATPVPTAAPQAAEAVPKLAPTPVPTPTPGIGAFQMQQAPLPVPTPSPMPPTAGRDATPGEAGASAATSVPGPSPAGIPPVSPVGGAGTRAFSGADGKAAPPVPQPSPEPGGQSQAEILQPTIEPPTPSQTPSQTPEYLWPVRQFEIALVAFILILISVTTYFWLRGKKE
ncbi:MAG: zf-HC2 domain-containing protein [Dehalococcoidia bacterium]|nr:zf-HC2 domain-containing protein [Dehalococcoidia bacterium]